MKRGLGKFLVSFMFLECLTYSLFTGGMVFAEIREYEILYYLTDTAYQYTA